MEQVLLKEVKYSGQYVAIKDINDPVVIASGDDPQKIYEEAARKGYSEPVILYIPAKDMVQIYYLA